MFSERDLQEARDRYEEALRAKARLDTLQQQVPYIRQNVEALEKARIKEDKDVSRMENGSLAAFFYAVIGKSAEKLDKERAEALEAAVRYEAAAAELKAVEEETEQLIPVSHGLAGWKLRLDELRAEKQKMLMASRPELAEQLSNREEEIAQVRRQLRETEQAVRAGKRALETAKEAVHELEEADGLAGWDVMGGGKIADFLKHEHMDAAQSAINRLQGELRLFRSEMNDVRMTVDVSIQTDSFEKFLDVFWDNIFTDWSMMERIEKALSGMRSVRDRIAAALNRLDRMQQQTKEELQEKQAALERFIEDERL